MKPQIPSLRKQEGMSPKPATRQEFLRWAPKASCQDCKNTTPVVVFSPIAAHKQVPEGELEGGVAFPAGLQGFVSLRRTMDIIYTSFLEVYHKEVSSQNSFRLSHHLEPGLKARAMVHVLP